MSAISTDPSPANDPQQVCAGLQWFTLARLGNGLREPPRPGELAVVLKPVLQFFSRSVSQQVSCCTALAWIHTHVQWGGVAIGFGKAKPTPGRIQLMRGHTEIEQNGVHLLDSQRSQGVIQMPEGAVNELDAVAVGCQVGARGIQSLRVQIESDQSTVWGRFLEDGGRVTSASQGSVQNNGSRHQMQALDALFEEHGDVMKLAAQEWDFP